MNIIKYLSEKIKKGLKKTKLYAATAILTVTTATVGTLTACASKTNNNSEEPTKVVTEIQEATPTPIPTVTPTQPVEVKTETTTVVEPYNALSSYGTEESAQYNMITSLSHDDAKFYTTSKIIYDSVDAYDIKGHMDILAYFLKKIDFNYTTYYDVYLALDNAKYLSDGEKAILREAIKNLETQAESYDTSACNYDLVGLYYNLPDLRVKYYYDIAHPWRVHFNPYDKSVAINTAYVKTDIELKEAIVLGCIGYPAIKSYAEIDGKKIYTSTTEFCMTTKDGKKEIIEFGESFEDALATIIANRALKQAITPENTQYYAEVELFNIYLELANMTPTEYQHYGYHSFIHAIQHNSILDGIIPYIRKLDEGPRTQGAWMGVTCNNSLYHSVATETLSAYILNVRNAISNNTIEDQNIPRDIDSLKDRIRDICSPNDWEMESHKTSEGDSFTLDDIREEVDRYVGEYFNQKEISKN